MALSIGLVGVTGYGAVHLEQILVLHRTGRARLCAVTIAEGSVPEPLLAEFRHTGCQVYTHYTEMLAGCRGKLDLCCLPTPIHWHAEMTLDCLKAGAHVLVEKPLAGSLEECQAIQAAQKETGHLVAVGFQNVLDPSTHEIKNRLLNGAIGSIRRMYGFGLSPRSNAYYERNNWAGKLHFGGRPVLDSPANNAMAHYLQWLLFIGGLAPEESLFPVSIEAELYRANPIEGPDTVNLRIGTNADIDVRFVVSHASPSKLEMELRVEGTRGTLVWRQNGNAELLRQDRLVETFPVPTHREMQMNVIDRVIQFLETGTGFVCTPEHAEMHTRCIVAAHKATAIVEVSGNYINVTRIEGSEYRHIEGILEAVRDSAFHDLSFSALGIPWASVPPKRNSLLRVAG